MARPIKETPTLSGKDLEQFLSNMDHPAPAPKEEIEMARREYELLKQNSPGYFL